MASKELKFTKGYNQEELDAWWKMVGYPGAAPRIPEHLVGKHIGRGRDAYSVWDLSTGKLDKKSRESWKDLEKTYGKGTAKATNDFRNELGKYTDPFREQSGISKVAGGVLNFAMNAFGGPVGALMTNIADYGNAALGNNDGTSYTDGRRSDWDRYGALAGSIYSGLDGPGSYGASGEKAPGWVKNANTGVKLVGGALAKPPEGPDFDFEGGVGDKSPSSSGEALEAVSVDRERAPDPQNFLRYGMGPEHSFFRSKTPEAPPPATGVAPPTSIPQPQGGGGNNFANALLSKIKDKYMAKQGMAEGGATHMLKHYPLRPKQKPSRELQNFAALPGMEDPRVRIAVGDRKTPTQFVSQGTGAGGREDNIDAKLSENEYVIDAETVALLGDGSPEAGAKKLDAMREGIRRHKGQALAKGKISPNAKEGALHYMSGGRAAYAEGGKVGALKALFKRKPKPDPNANLRRINSVLEEALRRKPVEQPRRATAEELEKDVAELRREVGAQGGDTRPLNRARGGALTNYCGGK